MSCALGLRSREQLLTVKISERRQKKMAATLPSGLRKTDCLTRRHSCLEPSACACVCVCVCTRVWDVWLSPAACTDGWDILCSGKCDAFNGASTKKTNNKYDSYKKVLMVFLQNFYFCEDAACMLKGPTKIQNKLKKRLRAPSITDNSKNIQYK